MQEHLVWKWKEFNESGVFMGLVFSAAIISRGYTGGQKLSFCGVSQTSPSDKIKLMWLLVLISKAAGRCNVFGMTDLGEGEKPHQGIRYSGECWTFLMSKCKILFRRHKKQTKMCVCVRISLSLFPEYVFSKMCSLCFFFFITLYFYIGLIVH